PKWIQPSGLGIGLNLPIPRVLEIKLAQPFQKLSLLLFRELLHRRKDVRYRAHSGKLHSGIVLVTLLIATRPLDKATALNPNGNVLSHYCPLENGERCVFRLPAKCSLCFVAVSATRSR